MNIHKTIQSFFIDKAKKNYEIKKPMLEYIYEWRKRNIN